MSREDGGPAGVAAAGLGCHPARAGQGMAKGQGPLLVCPGDTRRWLPGDLPTIPAAPAGVIAAGSTLPRQGQALQGPRGVREGGSVVQRRRPGAWPP